MTRRPDPDAKAVEARETLDKLRDALTRTYRLRYDDDHQREPETPTQPTPTWRPHWLGPTKIQKAYVKAVKHLYRAGMHLCDNTDAEDVLRDPDITGSPVDRTRHVSLGEAHLAVHFLEQALGYLATQHREGWLMPPEKAALLKACDEISASMHEIPEGLEREWKDERPRCRRTGCRGPDGRPRVTVANQPTCPACRKRDSRAKQERAA